MKKIISSFLSALLVLLCLSANSQTYSNLSLSVSAVAIVVEKMEVTIC